MINFKLHSMFIDFNSFFASVEQELEPRLRDRPVAVVPLVAETTCCIAASKEAKQFGVKTGTQVREARKLCPGLVVIEARPGAYIDFHDRSVKVIEECGVTPEVCSIDEVHCPLWGEWTEEAPARDLARHIKKILAEEIGARMTCSIGLAPNKFLAKMASDMQKPDGLVTIRHADLPDCLHGLELRDLYGIGANMEIRLRAHAIESVEHLCGVSKAVMRDIWGGVEGERFHDALHGLHTRHRETERRSLGHSHILPPELRTEAGARSVLHRLTQKAAMRLRSCRCVAGRMSVFLKSLGDRQGWNDEIRFNPTQDTLELLHTLDLLWQRRSPPRNTTPFAVGVNFLDLQEEKNAVAVLFDRDGDARRRALLKAVDAINLERKNAVYFAGAHGAQRYTPMRIAFNRIPDPATEG